MELEAIDVEAIMHDVYHLKTSQDLQELFVKRKQS